MKKRFLLLFCSALFLLITAPTAAWAGIFQDKYTKTQMVVPQGWRMSTNNGVTTVIAKDNMIVVSVWAAEDDGLETKLSNWLLKLDGLLTTDLEMAREGQDIQIGAFEALQNGGTGLISGYTVDWSITHIMASKTLIIATISFRDAQARYSKELKSMLASLKASQ